MTDKMTDVTEHAELLSRVAPVATSPCRVISGAASDTISETNALITGVPEGGYVLVESGAHDPLVNGTVRQLVDIGLVVVHRGESLDKFVTILHRPYRDSLYFVTSNPQKVAEISGAVGAMHLHACDLDLPELKHDDVEVIAADKARRAYDTVQRPVVCTDGGIFLNSYGGFPGSNSKQAATLLKTDGLLKLLEGIDDRTAVRRNVAAIYDGRKMRTYVSEKALTVATSPRGTYSSYPMDPILVPMDDSLGRTYAEIPVSERARFTELPFLIDSLRKDLVSLSL